MLNKPVSPLLVLHVCSAVVAMLSGLMAMSFRKGSGLHGAAGTVFFVSLLSASGVGSYLALAVHPNSGNAMGSMLSFYLVATAWVAAVRRSGKSGLFDAGALLFILGVVTAGAAWGLEAASSQSGSRDGYPAPFYFVFGSIALLLAVSDVRMLVRGGVFGAKRIARHLWRMGLALMFTTISFYPGQAKFFPAWFKATNLLYVPHVFVLGTTFFWLYRVSVRKRLPQRQAIDVRNGEAVFAKLAGSPGSV
jgi:uncharacterized membrane protein